MLVADSQGRLPDPLLPGGTPQVVIAIGDRSCADALAQAIRDGVTAAVDAAQPFGVLIHSIGQLLVHPPGREWAARQVAALREHARMGALLSGLTPREQDVLRALGRGESAADIARDRHLSMPTVRTHIRAILTRLDVSSQGAAVALAHRHAHPARPGSETNPLHGF